MDWNHIQFIQTNDIVGFDFVKRELLGHVMTVAVGSAIATQMMVVFEC